MRPSQAMEEVGGPVVAIALILAAVFIPTAAIPGITGRLYQQFAITIAISVLISAFNALTLSPALAALLLKPKDTTRRRGPLARFFDWFNRIFRPHHRQVRFHLGRADPQVRRSPCWRWRRSPCSPCSWASALPPASFPQEDQGYLFVALQLPDAASPAAHRRGRAAGHRRAA